MARSLDGGTTHPVRVLWAVPRSSSTAFERMMIERGDHDVVDEPYSGAYYHGPQRVSERYPVSEPDATVAAITDDLNDRARRRPVFVKDMAYHPADQLDRVMAEPWAWSFLIRDPRWSIPSMARVWPDLTADEAGFTAVDRAVDAVIAAGGQPLILDSDELCREPEHQVAAWCEAMGLMPDPTALSWTAGMREEWVRWPEWYGATSQSTGFAPPRGGDPPPVAGRVAELVEASVPVYERLRGWAIT